MDKGKLRLLSAQPPIGGLRAAGSTLATQNTGESHLAFWESELLWSGYCYVLRAGDLTPIKVGYATDVRARMASLQTGNAYSLRLLYVLPGPPSIERIMHLKLRALRVTRVLNEWFDGPRVETFLAYVADLAERMADAHDGGSEPPDVATVDPTLSVPARYRQHEISVTHVEPRPKVPLEEAERIRALHRGPA